jgi:dCTP deaminase
MLSGLEIKKRMKEGSIVISPYKEENLNPNSYNLTLSNELLVYSSKAVLDPKKDNQTRTLIIPEEGLILDPFRFYLGSTNEYTESFGCVPGIDGRSSVARLGLFVHVTAGFGDNGYKGTWTLEIMPVLPVKVYPDMTICQIYYHQIIGDETYYDGKYQNSDKPSASKFYLDFNKKI